MLLRHKRRPMKPEDRQQLEGVNKRLSEVEGRLAYVETQVKLWKKERD